MSSELDVEVSCHVPVYVGTSGAMGIYRLADEQPAGFIDYLDRHPRMGTPHIGLYVIHGDLHGQGYGTESLEAFLGHMRGAQGWTTVKLGVIAANEPAVHFWSARGFQRCGTATMALLHGPTEIILMERNLSV